MLQKMFLVSVLSVILLVGFSQFEAKAFSCQNICVRVYKVDINGCNGDPLCVAQAEAELAECLDACGGGI